MIIDDRKLLGQASKLNTAIVAFAFNVMDGSATAADHEQIARLLRALADHVSMRGDHVGRVIGDPEPGRLALPVGDGRG